MAEKKKPMGDDPLAWLGEGENKLKKCPVKRTRTRRSTASKAAKEKTETELIEQSFSALSTHGELLAERFYQRLFANYPDIESIFDGVSANAKQKNMLASLELLVQNLHKPEILKDYLFSLAVMHIEHEGTADHYPMFAENLLAVMAEIAGECWMPEVQQAWQNTLNKVTTIMLEAHQSMESSEMTNQDNTKQELAILRSAVEGSSTALMMCDKNRVITFANPSVMKLLENRLTELRTVFPRLDLSKVVGTCIDDFHKDPSLQKNILSDIDNLPYRNQIQLLDIHFDLNATAIVDEDGSYMGNMVEWQDITEIREEQAKNIDYQGQIDAIGKVMGVISFNMDGTIIDINQNFLDVVGYKKEEVIGQHHSMFADSELAASPEYTEFWAKLNRGEFDAGEYKRIGNGGKEIWLQASYNPIMDLNGKPFKVVKYATDISGQKQGELAVQSLIQAAQSGELEQRIELENHSGSMKTIAGNVNDLMDAVLKPINEAIRITQALAEGDLTKTIDESEYLGSFNTLAVAINTTVERLSETVSEINDSSENIGTAATEISEGNLDLSQRTESQASSLEETASSMEELTSTVRQNSDNARQANQLAASSREQAEKGGSVIKEAIDAMTAISSSSKKVTDIIGVIDEIAFQTNLLALNAAVEAARAGEQGRGFAVVASEVRNLAQRSASAAKEIKELINDSGEKVKEGSMLVDESGRTLEEIVASSKKVGDIISEIAAAGQEQTQGIEQVTKAIGQMDEMTQQNAALVEEAAAASESLDEQGKNLQRLMSFFSVDGATPDEKPVAKAKPAPKKAKVAAKKAKAAPKRKPAPVTAQDDEWDEF